MRRRFELDLIMALMALGTVAERVGAQETSVTKCKTPGGAVVTGLVVDDSTGRPVAGSRVYLLMQQCGTSTDAQGRFRFEDAAARSERIEASQPGYRRFRPVAVEIEPGGAVDIQLRLRPGGPIEDCRVLARCARLFDEPPPDLTIDEDRFRLAALATTIALAWKDVARADPWHACVDEPSTAVVRGLAARYTPIVPKAECAPAPDSAGGRSQLRHAPTASPAFGIEIARVDQLDDGRKRAFVAYFVAGLWAEGWRCDFRRDGRSWQPVLCVLMWES